MAKDGKEQKENKEDKIETMYRLIALLGYWSPVMSLIAAYTSYKRSRYAFFHSIQGGILNVLLIVFLQIQLINPETIIASLVFLFSWVMSIILFVSITVLMFASFFAESAWHFPLIGKIADHYTDKWYRSEEKK